MMNRAAMIGACVLLAGCTGGSQDDLKTWMDEQAKTMRGAVRPLPELRQVPVVAYAGTQGDDPDTLYVLGEDGAVALSYGQGLVDRFELKVEGSIDDVVDGLILTPADALLV